MLSARTKRKSQNPTPGDQRNLNRFLNKSAVKIILPVTLAVLLFVMTIFLYIIPLFEEKLMDGKRETIRELTEFAWSILDKWEKMETAGLLTRKEAQEKAMGILRDARYGPGAKDYFWINDMHPFLLMHPYRADLEGKDITDYTDPNGKKLFIEFVKIVKAKGEGYVDYEWQWMDDPKRIVPKISYVKGFSPWGWIVGTGIYVEDVHAGIAAITQKLTLTCLLILMVMLLLSFYIVRRNVIVEREKKEAEKQAKIRQEQLFRAAKMVSLGTLVSGVAHEINNPVTSSLLNTQTLRKVWESILPILDEYEEKKGDFKVGNMRYSDIRKRMPMLLSHIEDGARRVKSIVTDLGDFSRERPSEHTDDIDLNTIIPKALALVSNLVKKSTDNFSVEYGEGIPCFRGNSQRIEQIVINIVMNACQALPDSSKAVRVVTGYDDDPGMVFFEVVDQGVGIPDEIIQRIKDPFFTTKRDHGGTGLGLAICDKIVRDHNGKLEFFSGGGIGTRARVSFSIEKENGNNEH